VIADLGCIIPTALKTPKGEPSSTWQPLYCPSITHADS
jgi:hypothetical protein